MLEISAPEALRPVGSTSTDGDRHGQLQAVAQEFESLLLNMMMKAMRASVPRSELFGDQSHIQMYEEMRDEEVSKVMAHRGGLGFSELILRQFERDPEADPTAAFQQTQALRAAADSYRAYGQTSYPENAAAGAASTPISQEEKR